MILFHLDIHNQNFPNCNFNFSYWSFNWKPSIYKTDIDFKSLGSDPFRRSLIVRGCQKGNFIDGTLFSNENFSITTGFVSTDKIAIEFNYFFGKFWVEKLSSLFLHCNLSNQSPKRPESFLNGLKSFFRLVVSILIYWLDLPCYTSNLKLFKCFGIFRRKFLIFFTQENHVAPEMEENAIGFERPRFWNLQYSALPYSLPYRGVNRENFTWDKSFLFKFVNLALYIGIGFWLAKSGKVMSM